MTQENYNYRTSQTMLRNKFPGKDKWKIPIIPRFEAKPDDFSNLLLIGFDKTNVEDVKHLDRMVHFFLYDYRFERVWKSPDADIERLSRYRAVLSPDFSMYLEMAPVMQLYNTFRNRWCGAYWASKGMRVIPTVNWGDESTFDFCFEGIEKGSAIAVSTYMASEHGNRKDQKEWFMAGYNEMLRRIEPEKIICYNTPFPEMQGDIIYVDYELSSWKYMSYDKADENDLECYKIPATNSEKYDTMSAYMITAGGGSAYGGKWRPAKPDDERFLGEPGEIKTTYKNGYRVDTKIGNDGKAEKERHYTNHNRADKHSDPHDHMIGWVGGDNHPVPGSPINYPDGAPEFKKYGGYFMQNTIIPANTPEQNRFKTISDFKWCVQSGGEIEFTWNGRHYGVFGKLKKTESSPEQMLISEVLVDNYVETEKWCDTADEVLEYMVGGDRLRDVITQVTVLDRTI